MTVTTACSALMAELVELLGAFPVAPDASGVEAVSERLMDLEGRARALDAGTETMAAIQGARALLGLTTLPPLPPLTGRPGATP